MAAIMDFEADWRRTLIKWLTEAGHPPDGTEDTRQLAIRCFNLRKRRISVRPRQVERAATLVVPAALIAAVDNLQHVAESGDDLNPYLSERVLSQPDYNDGLLNEWGLDHFHLGPAPKGSDTISGRTPELLIVRVTPTRFLMVKITSHGSWAEQKLVQIMHDNWADEISGWLLPEVVALPFEATNGQLAKFRGAGIGTILRLRDGEVYAPIGGGFTTSGVAREVSEAASSFALFVKEAEAWVHANLESVLDALYPDGRDQPDEPHLHLVLDDRHAWVVEALDGKVKLRLGDVPRIPRR